MSVLNHYYGRDDIVLGAYKGEFGKYCNGDWVPGEYVYDLVNNYESPVWNSDQVDEATVAYRKVLAAAEDNTVKIAAIGKHIRSEDDIQMWVSIGTLSSALQDFPPT